MATPIIQAAGFGFGGASVGENTVTLQSSLAAAGVLTFSGTPAAKPKRSWTLKSLTIEGGADGDVHTVDYVGATGPASLVLVMGAASQPQLGFATNFGTDWTITSGSASAVLVSVLADVVSSPAG